MIIVQDKKTKKYKQLYTGEELIIAIGKKYEKIHEAYKEKYDRYYDFFDEKHNPINKVPLFKDEEEFYNCLIEGSIELRQIDNFNSTKLEDENGNVIKINHAWEYREYKNKLLKSIKTLLSSILIIIISYIVYKIVLLHI